MLRRAFFVVASIIAAAAAAPGSALAQYPDRPLKFVVPWPPGGAADMMARMIAEGITKDLGQPVVVDNRPGAGGLIATEQVTRMPGDGYTLLLGSTGPNAIAGGLYSNLRYDPVKDLAMVTQITELPLLLLVNKDLPVNSVGELIAYAKANPGKINYGSVGAGTAQHLASEIFKLSAGLDMVHVPYKGSAPAFADLASGQVHMLFDNIPASRAMIESGKVRALAVSTRSRASAMPNVPTVDESGLPGYHVSAWQNIAMPPSTPADIVNRINREIVKFMSTPEMRKRATDMGANIALNKPEEEAERIRQEAAQWRKAVTAAGIKLEY